MTTFILDLDGTLYWDGNGLPGAASAVWKLERAGHVVLYATNDATTSSTQHISRLRELGFSATPHNFLSSAAVAAERLNELDMPTVSVLLIGTHALAGEIASRCPGAVINDASQYGAVVVGLDTAFTYEHLAAGLRALDAGAHFLATNSDPSYLDKDGARRPGAGALVAALEVASGRKAEVAGKPYPTMYERLLSQAKADTTSLVVVGDSETDIIAAAELNATTVLVLSGVSTRFDAELSSADVIVPSFVDYANQFVDDTHAINVEPHWQKPIDHA